jgi:hypothetical protein
MCDGRPVHTDVMVIAELQEFPPVNWELLSVIMDFGTPNRWDDVHEKGHGLFYSTFVIVCNSIHLENLSTATSTWV